MTLLEVLARLPPRTLLSDGEMTWDIEGLTEAAQVVPDEYDYAMVVGDDGLVQLVASTGQEVVVLYRQVASG